MSLTSTRVSKMVILKYLIISMLGLFLSNISYANSNVIRFATTTSTANSGLLKVLIPEFEKQSKYKVKAIVAGTGKALRLAREGRADLVMVHAPKAEMDFVNAGFGIKRHYVMHNDFIVIGPKSDPAGIKNKKDIINILKHISTSKHLFVSRADDSGTHKKEMGLWRKTKIEPYGDWYLEAGMSMGKALKLANKEQAYILSDRGTWLAKRDILNLTIVFEGDEGLNNPYSIIAVNPSKNKGINDVGNKAFINWILSKKGQAVIENFRLKGERLFIPAIKKKQ